MQHRTALPRRLGDRFTVRKAEAAGIRPGRHSAPDLHRPFSGVRSVEKPTTFDDFVTCCALRFKSSHRLGGKAAARHWGLPLSKPWDEDEPIDVIVPTGMTPPKTHGIRGRRLKSDRAETRILKGIPVIDAVATVFTCAADLTVDEAVTMIDALVTTAMNYPNLGPGRPLSTLAAIEARLAQWGQFPGHRTIRAALPFAREKVESPKETETRLLIISNGLPEPVVQYAAYQEGKFLARVDLAYPELKIAIEYDGDGHRKKKSEWRRDIQRQRALEAAGWIILHLTEVDLAQDEQETFIGHVRRAIAQRTA